MTNKMLALQETFKQKSALLDQAQTLLKEEFVGIDNIIDEVIEHVRSWFILSDFQEKPIILNLWGLTGTGKTTLVNRLMTLINYSQKTYRFDLGEKDSKTSFRSSIDDLCENPDDAPIVIILDEIQHARTLKAPFREEIEDDKN
jgi:ATP-dependent Clp protease ATP-binding subunit ClpA